MLHSGPRKTTNNCKENSFKAAISGRSDRQRIIKVLKKGDYN